MSGIKVGFDHDLIAERSVLGAILLNNENIYHVVEMGLTASDFYVEAYKKVFEVCLSLSKKGEPVDLVTLNATLRERGLFEDIGGSATLTGLFDSSSAVENVLQYAKIIIEQRDLRDEKNGKANRDWLSSHLSELAGLYNRPTTGTWRSLWLDALSDLEAHEIIGASFKYILSDDCSFFPMPGKLYKIARPPKEDFYDSREWQELRYAIIAKYGRVCMACGDTTSQIHVDHIKSRSKYPKLSLVAANLQVLCKPCNLGKSDLDETDWRPILDE